MQRLRFANSDTIRLSDELYLVRKRVLPDRHDPRVEVCEYESSDGLRVVVPSTRDPQAPQPVVSVARADRYASEEELILVRRAFFSHENPVNETRMSVGPVDAPFSVHLWETWTGGGDDGEPR